MNKITVKSVNLSISSPTGPDKATFELAVVGFTSERIVLSDELLDEILEEAKKELERLKETAPIY